jgi:cytidylate kinase
LDADATADTPARQATRTASRADLILEVRTINWKVRANPRLRVWYDGTLRLTDARTNRVLAEGVCASHPVTASPRENHAALGQGEMDDTIDFCVEDYRHRVLGLY